MLSACHLRKGHTVSLTGGLWTHNSETHTDAKNVTFLFLVILTTEKDRFTFCQVCLKVCPKQHSHAHTVCTLKQNIILKTEREITLRFD